MLAGARSGDPARPGPPEGFGGGTVRGEPGPAGRRFQELLDTRMCETYYSDKKKRYTVKTQLMVNNRGFIIHKANHKKGGRHDYDVYKKNHPVTPKEVVNVFDLGYLGIEKDFPQQLSSLPNRKKRNLELSQEEMESNKNHSKKRSDRTYHLSIEKIQNTCRRIQKQIEKV